MSIASVDRLNATPPSPAEEMVRNSVIQLLSSLYPTAHVPERRREQRYAYPHFLCIAPVGADRTTPLAESVTVVGKHLSIGGIGFFHPKPIPHRRVIVSFEGPAGIPLAFLTDLTWCRFSKYGWYESGGKFLSVATPSLPQSGTSTPRAVCCEIPLDTGSIIAADSTDC